MPISPGCQECPTSGAMGRPDWPGSHTWAKPLPSPNRGLAFSRGNFFFFYCYTFYFFNKRDSQARGDGLITGDRPVPVFRLRLLRWSADNRRPLWSGDPAVSEQGARVSWLPTAGPCRPSIPLLPGPVCPRTPTPLTQETVLDIPHPRLARTPRTPQTPASRPQPSVSAPPRAGGHVTCVSARAHT